MTDRPARQREDVRSMTGQIHAIETMGLVDGPGVRAVVFFQGCRLRCQYCHNPDTWRAGGKEMTVSALVQRLVRMKSYFRASGGGVTISGGEPLLQPQFLLALLKGLRAEGIHTCLDTAGIGLGDYDEILAHTDLVLYDVKHWDAAGYRQVTGGEEADRRPFEEALRRSGVPIWVRHVVVPGLTEGDAHLRGLRRYVDGLPDVERVELLPYHSMGNEKYEGLGLVPPLRAVPDMDRDRCQGYQTRYFGAYSTTKEVI